MLALVTTLLLNVSACASFVKSKQLHLPASNVTPGKPFGVVPFSMRKVKSSASSRVRV